MPASLILRPAILPQTRASVRPRVGRARSLVVSAATGKIAVFGGSGGTGGEVIFQALEQGYEVVTLARCVPPRTLRGHAIRQICSLTHKEGEPSW